VSNNQKQQQLTMKHLLLIVFAFAIGWGCNKTDDVSNDIVDDKKTEEKSSVVSDSSFVIPQKELLDSTESNAQKELVDSTESNAQGSGSGVWYTSFTGNYIDAFCIPKSVRLYSDDQFEFSEKYISFAFDYAHRFSYNNGWEEMSNEVKYEGYAKYYGDTTYTYNHDMSPRQRVCAMPLMSINVVADRDFDESHPAGASLNDLFTFKYVAHYSFVKNGYLNDKEGERDDCPTDSVAVLSDFRGASLFSTYIDPLFFNKLPATPGKYTFTVTLTFGEDPLTGEKVELAPASIVIEF
jgi:hypothetical protein